VVVLQQSRPPAIGSEEAASELFRRLRECWPGRRLVVDIALPTPVARVKVLTLPGLSGSDLRRMVAQGTQRFFLRPVGPQLTDAVRVERRRRAAPTAVLVAAAPESTIAALLSAGESAGVSVEQVSPASVALVKAALTLAPGLRSGEVAMAASLTGSVEIALLRQGRLLACRSRPWSPIAQAGEQDWLGEAAALVAEMAAAHEAAPRVVALLGSFGGEPPESLRVGNADTPVRALAPDLSAEALAAWGATRSPGSGPVLLPEPRRRALLAAELRRVGALATLATITLGAAGFVHQRTLETRLAELRQARTMLRPVVDKATEIEESLSGVRARVEALHGLAEESISWPWVVAALAEVLPRDAHLTEMAADGARLRLEGEAPSAAVLAARLDSTTWFERVDLAPALRVSTPAGAREQFRIDLVLKRRVFAAARHSTSTSVPAGSPLASLGAARVPPREERRP
jgi:hypothetical protein